jgi:hypothetical protein
VSTFYLLPPRPLLAERLVDFFRPLFPDLHWTGTELVDALDDAVTSHPGVYVVHREDLPPGEDPADALADGFGAEPGDEVIEVRPTGRLAGWSVNRWRLPATVLPISLRYRF